MNEREWAVVAKSLKNLYRTAQIHHEKNCEEFTYSSMIYFRYRFQKKRAAYPMNKEIEATKHYLACKKFEKGPGFHYEVDVDESILSYLVPYYCVLALLERCEDLSIGAKDRKCKVSIEQMDRTMTIVILDSDCEGDQDRFLQEESDSIQEMMQRIELFGTGQLRVVQREQGIEIELQIQKRDGRIW